MLFNKDISIAIELYDRGAISLNDLRLIAGKFFPKRCNVEFIDSNPRDEEVV